MNNENYIKKENLKAFKKTIIKLETFLIFHKRNFPKKNIRKYFQWDILQIYIKKLQMD